MTNQCIMKQCEYQNVPSNGTINGWTMAVTIAHGNAATITCDPGFDLVDSAGNRLTTGTLTCNAECTCDSCVVPRQNTFTCKPKICVDSNPCGGFAY